MKTKAAKPVIEQIELAKLVKDYTLYPRNDVNDMHVRDLLTALTAGATLPPIIAEAKTFRIVDGFHRYEAFSKHLGTAGVVPVELRTYASDAALFLDAVALNSGHGRKLDRHDQTRIVLRLRELHVDDQTIAVTLHVPEPEIPILAVRVLHDSTGQRIPLKRGLQHLRGQKLTANQIKVVSSVRSGEAGRLCMELSGLLREGLVDLTDHRIVTQLQELAHHIEEALRSVTAA